MRNIKLTSKRQATFPAKLLTDLGLKPGDEVELLSKEIDGEKVWVLRPKRKSDAATEIINEFRERNPEWGWIGTLKKYARREVDWNRPFDEIRDEAYTIALKDNSWRA